jgi:carboxylate-amine ligase
VPARRQDFTIGVEEEYQIVDPVTRHLRASSDRILRRVRPGPGAEVQPELHSSQIEIAGPYAEG